MWLVLSVIAAIMTGFTVILQKSGSSRPDVMHVSALCNYSSFATMLVAVLISGSFPQLWDIPLASWQLSIASGVVQALSWVTYFIAIKDADINAMMSLDKLNIVATMLLAWAFLGERITWVMLLGAVMILWGSAWMANIHLRNLNPFQPENRWVISAIVSPILMAGSNIIAKLDDTAVSTDLSSLIRMFVVAAVIGLLALFERRDPAQSKSSVKVTTSLIGSGVLVGASYLLMYRALILGTAAAVTTIVKGSIIITTILAWLFYGERLSKKGYIGFFMVCAGILCFAF